MIGPVECGEQALAFILDAAHIVGNFGAAEFRDFEREEAADAGSKSRRKCGEIGILRLPNPKYAKFHRGGASGALADQFMQVAPLSGPPQSFEVVKLTGPRGEDVDDEIHIVDQNPIAFAMTFRVQRSHALLAEFFVDGFCDRLIVTSGRPRTDHKVIGEGAYAGEFENCDVLRLLIES